VNPVRVGSVRDTELLRVGALQYPTPAQRRAYARATRELKEHRCSSNAFSKLAIETAAAIARQLSAAGATALANPTQGLFGALLAMKLCRVVHVYGVDSSVIHAARQRSGRPQARRSGNPFHYYDGKAAQHYFAPLLVHTRHVHDLLGESRFICEELARCRAAQGRTWECRS